MRWLPVLLLVGVADAGAEDIPRVDVELGASVEKNVAYARGYMCDDPALVSAEMVTRDDHNVWIVKGVKLGATLCRVGLETNRVHYVFEVHVLPKRTR